jgi:isopentenyldiphosphate isomerase
VSEELLDYYDANLVHLGVKSRADVHRDGDWHRIFHCNVIYRDRAGQDFIIFQKRSADKATYANMLDVAAAGHYAAGETGRDGVRELQEELGLDARFEDLIPIGRRVSAGQYGSFFDYEVADVYFYVCDRALSDYVYQREEVAGLVAVNIAEAVKLFTGQTTSISCEAAGFATPQIDIRVSDFVSTRDNYFLKVMLLAKQCLHGERLLFV